MSEPNYYYLDVELKLREGPDQDVVLTAAYFQSSIENSLHEFFGEIGGQTELELVQFCHAQRRGIIKVPEEFYSRTRTAITLIGQFQNIPCHFQVSKASKDQLDF